MKLPAQQLKSLKKLVEREVFVTKNKERIFSSEGDESNWLFDFRRVLLKPQTLKLVGTLFWKKFKTELPFQIGGIEVAAIPLITGLVLHPGNKTGVSGFFIRKSRKKDGLVRMTEGEINEKKIILVDDLINSGKSFIRQVEVIESLGKKVSAVFTILRYRDLEYYAYFHEKGIKIASLFTLDDFKNTLGLSNRIKKEEKPVPMPFKLEWYFKSENPNFYYVVPKSAPTLDDKRVYFGSDSGNFWALNQSDGSVAWKYKVGFHAKGKYIFSSPAVYRDTVYFGAYDGNFYALDAATGKRKWVFMDADWIGSSPAVAPDLGLVFIGLEFGLWKKKGGIAALDAATGENRWEYFMPGLTHSSPAYSKKHGIVVIGCNDYVVRGFSAKSGKLLWEFPTGGEVKESFAFDDARDTVVFGSHDSYIYVLAAKTGKVVHKIKTDGTIYSSPVVYGTRAYVSSLDKNLYAVDLVNGKIDWKFPTSGRVFASPVLAEGKLYIGSNDGRLYELDPETGKNTALFQTTERITNAVAYNPVTKRFFVPTFANEIYCLSRGTTQ